MRHFPDYPHYDGLGLAALVRTRQVTPLELVEAAIARIEALNPGLNAVTLPLYEQARAAAALVELGAPFAGVPMVLKDFWCTYAGIPTSAGNRLLRAIPRSRDSELVRRWKGAGALIVGKTNTPELALQATTEPEAFGPTRNPWDLSRSPAGSSGGTAAAVAARLVPIGGATDGGGSIRVPASCCGLFGLKVSRGRTPSGPERGEMWGGLGVEHVITRSVRDSAAMLDATAGLDPGAPYGLPAPARAFRDEVGAPVGRLRIAVTDRPLFGRSVDPACSAALRDAATLLATLGHEVAEDAPAIDGAACARAMMTLVMVEIRVEIVAAARLAGRRPHPEDFEAATYAAGLLGAATGADAYVTARHAVQRAARDVGRFFERYDLLVTPTLAQPPLPLGHFALTPAEAAALRVINQLGAGWLLRASGVADRIAARLFDFMAFTPLFNLTGQPAMSVPLFWTDGGLPIGVQVVARYGDEAGLLRLAGHLEQARPWANRAPPGYLDTPVPALT